MNGIVTIEKDGFNGCFIFKFPFFNNFKNPIYSLIGRLYLEIGEDQIVSYTLKEVEKELDFIVLEVRTTINWETEEKEQGRIQEILQHRYESGGSIGFSFCPLNFDLTLTPFYREEQSDNLILKHLAPDYFERVNTLWSKQTFDSVPRKILIKGGQTAFYSALGLNQG